MDIHYELNTALYFSKLAKLMPADSIKKYFTQNLYRVAKKPGIREIVKITWNFVQKSWNFVQKSW